MNEAEWDVCTDPQAMLTCLRTTGKASDRKLRLFAVACCSRTACVPVFSPDLHVLGLAERYADGEASAAELAAAFGDNVPFSTDPELLEDAGLLLLAHPDPLSSEAVSVLVRRPVVLATAPCTTYAA